MLEGIPVRTVNLEGLPLTKQGMREKENSCLSGLDPLPPLGCGVLHPSGGIGIMGSGRASP
jgi:hypothetical protein